MRRHGALELLLVLPDGSKSLVPAAWTDVDPWGVDERASASTLGSLSDLLQACDLVVDLAERRGVERGQAARKSPCKEDFHAACPAQSDARPGPGAIGCGTAGAAPARGLPTEAVAAATALLAGVIAKAAAPTGREATADE